MRRQQNRIQTGKGQGTARRATGNSTNSDQGEFGDATLGDRNRGVGEELEILKLESGNKIEIEKRSIGRIETTGGIEWSGRAEKPE